MATGLTTVSAANLCDSTGTKIANATIYFQPVLSSGQPTSYEIGATGGGAVADVPVSAPVTAGAFTIQLADTTLTNPVNIGYAVTVIDNVTGDSLLGPGYNFIQPFGATWSLDTYQPGLTLASTLLRIGIGAVATLPAGSAATVTNSGVNGATVLNFGIPQGEPGSGSGGGGGSGIVLVDPSTSAAFTLALMSGRLEVVPTAPVLIDAVTGMQYALQVTGGRLSVVETSGAVNPVNSVSITDVVTGTTHLLTVASGRLTVT